MKPAPSLEGQELLMNHCLRFVIFVSKCINSSRILKAVSCHNKQCPQSAIGWPLFNKNSDRFFFVSPYFNRNYIHGCIGLGQATVSIAHL